MLNTSYRPFIFEQRSLFPTFFQRSLFIWHGYYIHMNFSLFFFLIYIIFCLLCFMTYQIYSFHYANFLKEVVTKRIFCFFSLLRFNVFNAYFFICKYMKSKCHNESIKHSGTCSNSRYLVRCLRVVLVFKFLKKE